jgi:LTXXQ motif family protein
MRELSRPLLLSMVIALSGITATPIFAARSSAPGGHEIDCVQRGAKFADGGEQPMLQHMTERLQLTSEQRPGVQGVLQKYLPELRDLRRLSCDNRKALKAMSVSDPKLEELAAAQGKTVANTLLARKRMHAALADLLTDAQRERLQRMWRSEGRGQWHHDKERQP